MSRNYFNAIILFTLFTLSKPFFLLAQYEFNNRGAQIYVQDGAIIMIDGDLINGNDSTVNGLIKSDGMIELTGNLENKMQAGFGVFLNGGSKERAIKFIGNAPQAITGEFNTPNASLYNLVIDKADPAGIVELKAPVTVEGSLVFGAQNYTDTYQPTGSHTINNHKGLVKTFDSAGEYLLSLKNGNTDAIAGYASMVMNADPNTGYIITSGARGNGAGGLERMVNSVNSYDFPVGSPGHGFNGVKINFKDIPAGGGLVKGKFNDGTDNADGYIGSMSQVCFGCTASNPSPDNNGYNRFFDANPFNNNMPQWLTLQDAIKNHGYWSFTATNDQAYKYTMETFPNQFITEGSMADAMRTIKVSSDYGSNPSYGTVDWTAAVDSVSNLNDLLAYTMNMGNYSGSGIPGGSYNGFGHFAPKMGKSGNALPVNLFEFSARPVEQKAILLTWSTALEYNNRGFEVQRSVDGSHFSTIGWVDGHNNSTDVNQYSYRDEGVAPNTIYYYRLNQLDFNGNSNESFIVSAIIEVDVQPGNTINIHALYPNPASEFSRIEIQSYKAQQMIVKMVNVVGQTVSEKIQSLSAGNNSILLNVDGVSSGNYIISFQTTDFAISKNLIVVK